MAIVRPRTIGIWHLSPFIPSSEWHCSLVYVLHEWVDTYIYNKMAPSYAELLKVSPSAGRRQRKSAELTPNPQMANESNIADMAPGVSPQAQSNGSRSGAFLPETVPSSWPIEPVRRHADASVARSSSKPRVLLGGCAFWRGREGVRCWWC